MAIAVENDVVEEIADAGATIENGVVILDIEELVGQNGDGHGGANVGVFPGVEVFGETINEEVAEIIVIVVGVDDAVEMVEEGLATVIFDQFENQGVDVEFFVFEEVESEGLFGVVFEVGEGDIG